MCEYDEVRLRIMQYDTVAGELYDGIATVTLDRPGSLNAFSPTLRAELVECLEDIRSIDRNESEPNVRAVVVEGASERAFSVGADVNADGDAPSPA